MKHNLYLLLVLLDDDDLGPGLLLYCLDDLSPLADNSGHQMPRDYHLVNLNGRLAQLTGFLQSLVVDDSLYKEDHVISV